MFCGCLCSVEGDYQLFAAKECEHLPWLDAVGELLSGLCSEPGACLFSQPPSAMQEEECACIKYLVSLTCGATCTVMCVFVFFLFRSVELTRLSSNRCAWFR